MSSGIITITSPSITTLSLTEQETEMKANDILIFFTSASATTSSPTNKGAGKRISWYRNTQPLPGILVPKTAEMRPLISTPWTMGASKEVFLANSGSRWSGFISPVSSAKSATSLALKALVSEAREPTWSILQTLECCGVKHFDVPNTAVLRTWRTLFSNRVLLKIKAIFTCRLV